MIIPNAFAQNVRVSSKADSTNLLIGDQVRVLLELKSDKKTNVVWPVIGDTLDKLEILSRTKIDTVEQDSVFKLSQFIVVTCFDSGSFTIPPFVFMYEKQGFNTMYPLETDSITLSFEPVKLDTAIIDIKQPIDESFSIWDYIDYIAIGLGLVILIGIAVFIFFKLRKKPIEQKLKYDPAIPAHIFALQELKKLDEEKLWQKGEVKNYYIRLSEILRLYIERQFKVDALEMITLDTVKSLKEIKLDENLINNIEKILTTSDLVKFAKFNPLPDENTQLMTLSVNFINSTLPMENNDKNNMEGKQ